MENTQIPRHSSLFQQIEYYLKLSLKSTTAKVTSCYLLSNPNLTEPFSRLSKQYLTLTTIVDSSKLIGENVEDDVTKRGFVVPDEGLEFQVGHYRPGY